MLRFSRSVQLNQTETRVTLFEFKKQNNSSEPGTWGWAAIYRAFGQKIDSGVLTVEYDIKAIKALNPGRKQQ